MPAPVRLAREIWTTDYSGKCCAEDARYVIVLELRDEVRTRLQRQGGELGQRALPVLHLVVANRCEPHPTVQKRLHTPRLLHDTSPSGRWSRFPGRAEEPRA